ncbi:VENN motif-containing pre-toxin protein [Cricetibacter osteomyelitidis]|uniref:VENN motif-containing pre-toxin protein n=1 Tax=Cricetibacter osteomyelitidis TaxID=1521931 RepID=A0A4R2SSC0_9PAST|nr:VENN motif pre-toxin domain-containing protein [Cricetibacter osteomyelitidis]TCP92065.1 VENN motif-containing pre-toxin protein [Cricetibacter osteomyelitidis]
MFKIWLKPNMIRFYASVKRKIRAIDGKSGIDVEANIKGLDITSRQDTEKYESKQISAGGSVSVTYGSGGGGSVNASYSKAKMDYAQVNQQSGIRVGSGGMDVNVEGHTQLNGAIIESEATTDKNQFSTKTFGSADMHNYSKLKTESVSINAGTSGFNPTSAAMSLLGNRRESDSSTTKSAVSANINLNVKNGGIPTALLRDTKNTNEKVGKQNLQKIREQQEMAKVIGEISDNAIKIAAHKELEAIEQANLELGKIKQRAKDENWSEEKIKNDPTMQRAQDKVNNAQKAYDDSYGIGSTKGQTIKAVTAALQGLANKSPEQAVVALASPYLNKKIHEATQNADGTINKPANLAAHAVLSAIEAQVTGNNALAGAVAGVTAEGTAMLIAEKFYDKPIDKLTSNEKQNVVFLSQLASGLAAGIVGNSTADTVAGAETGKRAVENNYLFADEAKERNQLLKEIRECEESGTDCSSQRKRLGELNTLSLNRNLALENACRDAVSSACTSERKILADAFASYNNMNYADAYEIGSDFNTDYMTTLKMHTQVQNSYMSDVAKEALTKMLNDALMESAELANITYEALAGNQVAQKKLALIGQAIKEFAASPIDTISNDIKAKLAEADQLELQGKTREADLLRMETYLNTELGVIGGTTILAKAIPNIAKFGLNGVGKLMLKDGVLSNTDVNIEWGPIHKQGKAWESYLQQTLPEGTLDLNSIKSNFKAFDHLLPDGTAISAKTMDTVGAKTYKDPKRITYQLNKYVDDMVNFKSDGKGDFIINNQNIKTKEMYLAIPHGTTKKQFEAINKSVNYAESLGVKIIVKEVK